MKTRFNKFTAWLLTLAMLMTLVLGMTFTAFAEDVYVASVTTAGGETTYYTDFNAAISAAVGSEDSTLTLLDNINAAPHVDQGKFTIDLNSKTWDLGYSGFILTASNVIITDNSIEGTGRMVNKGSGASFTQLLSNTKLEIAGGTIETAGPFVVTTGGNGKTQDAEFILSGGKLVTEDWAAILVDCRSVTIKGGEIVSRGDDINYQSGLLDFSQHPDPTGISVYFYPKKIMESSRIKLPEGYCFYEDDSEMETVASEIIEWYTYTIGKIVKGNEPKCICPNRCSLESLNGSCNACLSDVSNCTGEQWEPAQNITIFYKNTQTPMPYAYYWGSKAIISWIGVPMTHVENDIWSVSVPADAVNITFSYYDDDSPTDLTIPTDGSNYYDGSTWTTYVCSHEKYNNGICAGCGEVCEHNTFEDDKCTVCGTALENEIVKYDEAAKSATVTVKEAGTYSLIFAKYGEGNRLDKVDVVEFEFKKGENTVPQTQDFTLDTGDRIMLWQDMTTLVPLCEAYIVK